MNTIEDILLAIYGKHGVAASYTVNNFGCEVSHDTYIAFEVDAYKKHSLKEEAVQRLKDFLELDDILSYNKDALIQKIKQLEDWEEDIQYDLTHYKEKLKQLENEQDDGKQLFVEEEE